MSDESDWIRPRGDWPGPSVRAEALERQLDGDRAYEEIHGKIPPIGTPETRSRGFVGERLIHGWLHKCGIQFVKHGGVDALPDLEIMGQMVGCRLCKAPFWIPRFEVQVFDEHMGKCHERLFVGYGEQADEYLILGMASERDMFRGEYVPAGAPRWNTKVALSCWAVPVSTLVAPRAWASVTV